MVIPPPRSKPPTERTKTLYCSFCGQSQYEVKKMVAGLYVYICDECIALCASIVAAEDAVSPDDLERSG